MLATVTDLSQTVAARPVVKWIPKWPRFRDGGKIVAGTGIHIAKDCLHIVYIQLFAGRTW